MSSIVGLDLTRNLSYFSVPAAWATAFLPHVYAILAAGPSVYDNAYPRNFKDNVAKSDVLSKEGKLRIARAKAASDNGLENLGFFAAAVLAANQAGVDLWTLNALALSYAGVRLAYDVTYIFLQENRRLSWLRSAFYQGGVGVTLALWIKAGLQVRG